MVGGECKREGSNEKNDEDKAVTEGCGNEEGQQRGLVGKRGWRRTGAMKKRGRGVLSVLHSRHRT